MAYVSVPKDLTKVKNKVAFNLTKRQLICIGIGAAMGIPCYFLFRNALGINNAAVLMVLMMLPAFLFAMYEKDGMHLEDVLMHVIRVKFIRPSVRKYETENYYESDPDGEDQKTMRKEERKGGKAVVRKRKRPQIKRRMERNLPFNRPLPIKKWEGMVFAGCREMSIPNVSGFTISTIS